MEKEHFEIFIESAKIGNRLTLKDNKQNVSFKAWSIEDSFNGKTRFYNINESIYGFFIKDEYVDLYLIDESDKVTHMTNIKLK